MIYDYPRIVPVFVRGGLATDEVELEALKGFLEADPGEGVADLVVLEQPLETIYGFSDPKNSGSEDRGLPGRKLLMLTAAYMYCASHGIEAVALGLLRSDVTDETTREVLRTLESCFRMALGWPLRILTPYGGASEMQVMRRGRDLPLHFTFSCRRPLDQLHCGCCEHCSGRRKAFEKAGIEDRTVYASAPH
jgi:7-cyano-7-deazaguanine synthase